MNSQAPPLENVLTYAFVLHLVMWYLFKWPQLVQVMTTCCDRLLLTRILLVRPGISIVPHNLHTLLLIE